jgi:hypothetical protein
VKTGSQSRHTAKYGHDSSGTRNQESLCWRGPAGIYQVSGATGPSRSSHTPPIVEKEAPFKTHSTLKIKILSWVPTGLETKNYCAGEAQQQFNRPEN